MSHICPFCGASSTTESIGQEAPVISLVIPTYNEGAQIVENLHRIRSSLSYAAVASEIVVVDDGSSDGTWQSLELLRQTLPTLTGIRLSRNFGKEAAISAGLDVARGRACIVMDSDLQHPPELIPEMVRLWRDEGWDIVEGIKSSRGKESLLNRWGASVFYRTLRWLSGYQLSGASDFKLLDRKVVAAWQAMQERNTFFRGMISWLGYTRKQLAFHVPARFDSRSRWSLAALFRLAVVAMTAFSSLPLQLVTILGGLFLSCSFFFGIYALVLYFRGLALPGFTTIILLELMIGGVLMVSLGIIGTYVARIYEEAKHRPRYIIAAGFFPAGPADLPQRPTTADRWASTEPI